MGMGEGEDAEGPLAMLHDRVTSADIARVVAKATGIPVQSLLKGEREKLVHVSCSLCGFGSRVIRRPTSVPLGN